MNYCEEQYVEALRKENEMLKAQLVEKRKENLSGVHMKVEVDTTEIDEAMKKLESLCSMATKIDGLTGRIKRDLTSINRYATNRNLNIE